jgi:hypothetical protein
LEPIKPATPVISQVLGLAGSALISCEYLVISHAPALSVLNKG